MGDRGLAPAAELSTKVETPCSRALGNAQWIETIDSLECLFRPGCAHGGTQSADHSIDLPQKGITREMPEIHDHLPQLRMLHGQLPASERHDFMCALIGQCQLQHMASDQAGDSNQQQLHSDSPNIRRVAMSADSRDLRLRVILARRQAPSHNWYRFSAASRGSGQASREPSATPSSSA